MSNASLKEQLQAVASQFSATDGQKSHVKKSDSNKKVFKKPKPLAHQEAKSKPKWLEYVQYGVELLKVYFPLSFKSLNEVKPLKKGIKQDLIKQLSTMDTIVVDDKACMVKSLAYYVNTLAYHKSVVENATRIDLDGNPAGTVSAEEAKYSNERYVTKLKNKQTGAKQSPPANKEDEVS